MTLDLTSCVTVGPALPAPFLRFELEAMLAHHGLLASRPGWDAVRRGLRTLGPAAGPSRVHRHVIARLAEPFGFAAPERQEPVATREAVEDGGWLMAAADGVRLRAWSIGAGVDLDAPNARGRAYRFSPMRGAHRVLRATGERAGLLTDGAELRLLLSDPALPDSHLSIPIDGANGWGTQSDAPDSYRLLLALAGASGLKFLSQVLNAGQLSHTRLTGSLQTQARSAIEGFLQGVLDHAANRDRLHDIDAMRLWQEGLILVYRLLFILRLESAGDFSFASTTLWRTALSPNRALGDLVRRRIDQGLDTGDMLEGGLRCLFRLFRDGLSCSELSVAPLGGALFGEQTTACLDRLTWGDRAVAHLLDRLLWTMPKGRERERVHYGSLDVEDLGRIYEALLELEPGIAREPMVRVRQARLETVVPARQADAKNTPIEDIPSGSFFLRTGLGRKSTGSYYTPHGFVRFLVRETLAPIVQACSPDHNPNPAAILALKIVDPAAGSGHFLIEACRFLADALYAACRQCDRSADRRPRIDLLPDPDGLLAALLPSRCVAGEGRALAICRRLVAVNCLYGVDRNPLAIELAKVSLWLESHAEGLPLTFLDHRLVVGDSLTGPFFRDIVTFPVGRGPFDPLLAADVERFLAEAMEAARREMRLLNGAIGRNVADTMVKHAAKQRLDAIVHPLAHLARAWSGAAMLGQRDCNDEYLALAREVAATRQWPEHLTNNQQYFSRAGRLSLPWDIVFPEVFGGGEHAGFDVVLGNPPWETIQYSTKDFLADQDLGRGADAAPDGTVRQQFDAYKQAFEQQKRLYGRLYRYQKITITGKRPTAGNLDTFRLFAERSLDLAGPAGTIGMVLPSAFHANEGATAIRRRYLNETRLDLCLSFENRKKLFDIDSRFRFDLIVARRPGPTRALNCAFYLDGFDRIDDPTCRMIYDADFISRSGGGYDTLLELRTETDLAVARTMFSAAIDLRQWCAETGIRFGRDLHMTDDAGKFVPMDNISPGSLLPLHEGKTFHQFTDRWHTAPRYGVAPDALTAKPAVAAATGFWRLAFRDIASATNERTMIAAVLPPGVVCSHTVTIERRPWERSNADMLTLCAILNTYAFDWLTRLKAGSHLSLYIVEGLPMPALTPEVRKFLAHAALRLSCNHLGYEGLWREQLNGSAQPVVVSDEMERWRVRADADAVVAAGYGLDRSAYRRILCGFSHRSFVGAPELCLNAFDAITRDGLDRFCVEQDIYAAVALPSAMLLGARRRQQGGQDIAQPTCLHAGMKSRLQLIPPFDGHAAPAR